MDIGKKQTSIIYLDKDNFIFFNDDQSKNATFDLRPYVTNLEIVDREGLRNQIKSFVDAGKIVPANIVIILSDNILFVKGIAPGERIEDDDAKTQTFTDSVPFNHVKVKSYAIEGGKLLVGANESYYREIKEGFEKLGFLITGVIPIYSTGIIVDATQGFTDASAKIILKNVQSLAQYSFENIEDLKKPEEKKPTTNSQKPDKKRLYALVGVFGFLILMLAVVILNSMASNKPTPVHKQTSTPIYNSAAATPTVTAPPQATLSASLTPSPIKIEIISGNDQLQSVQTLKKDLTDAGITGVTSTTTQVLPQSPQITFGPNIPANLKTQIASFVSQVTTNFSTNIDQNAQDNVTITLIN